MEEHYDVRRDCAGKDEYHCRKCREAWVYPAGKSLSIAARLSLLNHAASHDKNPYRTPEEYLGEPE